jgi:biotin operon repressor
MTALIRSIPRGRDAARSISDIAESLMMSRRRVERDLEAIVLSGIPVIACERGVYRASTPQEAREYANSLRGRIAAVQARITALERWADSVEQQGQTSLWEAA